MIKVLVDTDIIIDFLRTDKGILPHLFTLQSEEKIELYISAVTVLELFSGKSAKIKKPNLDELISVFNIIELTRDLARFTGELKRDLSQTIAFADLTVAASALHIGAKLATRNRRHFIGIPNLRFF